MTFSGFPDEAVEFYEGLLADNSKAYWTAHRDVYERCVRNPMLALLDELAPEFGTGSMFRPHRDVRFSRDKSPYKTHAGAVIDRSGGGCLYVQLSADGLLAAAGMWRTTPDQVARLRAAVAEDRTGSELERLVSSLRERGYDVGGERLTRPPRGHSKDAPRQELLRHRTLTAGRAWEPAPWMAAPQLGAVLAAAWRELDRLNEWLGRHVGAARA